MNMDVYRDAKNRGNPLSNTIKDTGIIMCNPLSELCREGLCYNILDSIAKGISLFPRMVHPYIHIHSIE